MQNHQRSWSRLRKDIQREPGRGATVNDVLLIRQNVGKKMDATVADGILTIEGTLPPIDDEALRIGTSTAVNMIEATTEIAVVPFESGRMKVRRIEQLRSKMLRVSE